MLENVSFTQFALSGSFSGGELSPSVPLFSVFRQILYKAFPSVESFFFGIPVCLLTGSRLRFEAHRRDTYTDVPARLTSYAFPFGRRK